MREAAYGLVREPLAARPHPQPPARRKTPPRFPHAPLRRGALISFAGLRLTKATVARTLRGIVIQLPPSLIRFVEELEAAGFQRVAETYDERAFGNGLIDLTDDAGRRLRLVLDKGLWSVETQLASSWIDVYLVALALTGTRYQQRALSHEERVKSAWQVIELMPRELPDQKALLGTVDELRREVWEERYGAADQ